MCSLVDYAEAAVGSLSTEHQKHTTIADDLTAKVYYSHIVCCIYTHCLSIANTKIIMTQLYQPNVPCHALLARQVGLDRLTSSSSPTTIGM